MARILIAMRGDINAKNGSAFHLRNMIECLKNNHHEVSVLHCPDGPWDAPLCGAELNQAAMMIEKFDPDAVIADYSWMASIFDIVVGPVKKIVFVHDLRCRIVPCLVAVGYKDTHSWTEEKEGKLLKKADYLLSLCDDDVAICKKYAPTIRIGIALDPVNYGDLHQIPGRCIYVGSNNTENKIALDWFLKEVWPKVKAEAPDASLNAVLGYDENIHRHYAQSQVAVAPHIMKGGLKIKTAEAFSYGLPVVGNICAFDGFDLSLGFAGHDDPEDMAHTIIRILTNKESYGAYIDSSKIACKKLMTPQAAYGKLLEIL